MCIYIYVCVCVCVCVTFFLAICLDSVNYKLALAKGICHLPVWRLNPVLQQLLTFNKP